MPFALVTGGGRGIGLEVCKLLVARHKPVLFTARSPEQGKAVAEQLASMPGAAEVRCLPLEVADSASIEQLAALVGKEYDGQIDLLVNNAGILERPWSAEVFGKTLAVNVAGPLALTAALLPHLAPGAIVVMVSSGLGQLSNLSSDYAELVSAAADLDALRAAPFKPDSPMGSAAPGSGGMAPAYSVAKALLNRAVQLLSQSPDFKARNVSVVSTCPGWCRTDMGSAAAERSATQGAESVLWPALNFRPELNGSFTRDGKHLDW